MANAYSPDQTQTCNHSSHAKLIDLILSIPELVLKHHDRKNLVDVVLHKLAGHDGFELEKAAYFIQNKDFKATKGICGYSRENCSNIRPLNENLEIVDELSFDKIDYCRAIKNFRAEALIDQIKDSKDFSNLIAMDRPEYRFWETKNNNSGTLIFQLDNPSCCLIRDSVFQNAIKLLCLC